VTDPLRFDAIALKQLCRRNAVRRLALFGSRLKGSARPDSDIDLLVEFERGREPGLIGLTQLEIDLAGVFGGSKVDLRTAADLSPLFRDEVVRSAQPVYAA
jgi:uncharacterized protein